MTKLRIGFYLSFVLYLLVLCGGPGQASSQKHPLHILTNGSSLKSTRFQREPLLSVFDQLTSSLPFRIGTDVNLGYVSGQREAVNGIGQIRLTHSLVEATSMQSQKSVIDTAVVLSTLDTTRHVYSFDANRKMECDLIQKWTHGLWSNSLRFSYLYDANRNISSTLLQSWSRGQWADSARTSRTYDSTGNLVCFLDEQAKDGAWMPYHRERWEFNSEGQILLRRSEYAEDGELCLWQRIFFTYDSSGNMISLFSDVRMNGKMENLWRYTYTYDAHGNETGDIQECWVNNAWLYVGRTTRTYDAKGNQSSSLFESFVDDQWIMEDRSITVYADDGRFIEESVEKWSGSHWSLWLRFALTYDSNANIIEGLTETWDAGQLTDSDRWTYSYDLQGNVTSIRLFRWIDFSWKSTDWGGETGSAIVVDDEVGNTYNFGFCYDVKITYKSGVNGIAPGKADLPSEWALCQNYPNPFNPTTKIGFGVSGLGSSWVRLVVYDLLGREVAVLVDEKKEPGRYEVKFDGSGLSSGAYFYQLQAATFCETKKLLIAR